MGHMRIEGCCGVEQNWTRTSDELVTRCPECGRKRVVHSRIRVSDSELFLFADRYGDRRNWRTGLRLERTSLGRPGPWRQVQAGGAGYSPVSLPLGLE